MTDTRKEFEKAMRFSEEFRDGNIYQFSFMTAAWQSWQACQSLNDKRIENYKSAYETWQDKTELVQETSTAKELGLHRADVLKNRIEQLLAVIAKKDEALQACSDAMEYMSEYDIPLTLAEDTDKALALQPADVELVEIGEARIIDINGTGTFVWKKGNMPALAENPKLYTIKKKGK